MIKQANLENVRETLKGQLEDKSRLEQQKLDDQRRLSEEVQKKIEENKRIEKEKEENRRLQQIAYRNHLSSQALEIKDIRNSAYKLSPHERKINKNYSLDASGLKNNFSIGAQEILKSNTKTASIHELNSDNSMSKKLKSENYEKKPFENLIQNSFMNNLRPSIFN